MSSTSWSNAIKVECLSRKLNWGFTKILLELRYLSNLLCIRFSSILEKKGRTEIGLLLLLSFLSSGL